MLPNKLSYRKYKSFDKIGFLKDVFNLPEKNKLHRMGKSVFRVLNKHAPLKSKVISGNNKTFVTKTLKELRNCILRIILVACMIYVGLHFL